MIFDEYAIKSLIRPVPGFPKEGVTFRDITPLFQSPKALRMVADSLIQRYIDSPVTHIGAIDARGFLIGSILAYELNRPLVLFRKAGKLPADTLSASYATEYGEATLQMHRDALSGGEQVLLLDDLIATGGTFLAAASQPGTPERCRRLRSRSHHRPARPGRLATDAGHRHPHLHPLRLCRKRALIPAACVAGRNPFQESHEPDT